MSAVEGEPSIIHGALRRRLHWTIAVIVLAALTTGGATLLDGVRANSELLWGLFSLHKSLGVTVLLLTAARLASWLWHPLHRSTELDRLSIMVSGFVQVSIALICIALPFSGLLADAFLSGGAPVLGIRETMWKPAADPGLSARFASVHMVLAVMLCGLLLLHVGGALKHHIIERDATLAGMLRPVSVRSAPRRVTFYWMPAFLLVSLAAAYPALRGGSGVVPAVVQDANWSIDHSQSRITIGAQAEGFDISADFTQFDAAIRFTPENPDDSEVILNIDTASFLSGFDVVDEQVKSEDWLHIERNPVATWHAAGAQDLGDGRYLMKGSLTLGSNSAPVDIEFSLERGEGRDRASGGGTVDRRALGLGSEQSQASTGIDVKFDFVVQRKEPK